MIDQAEPYRLLIDLRSIEFMDQPLRDESGKVRRSQMRDEAIERMKAHA